MSTRPAPSRTLSALPAPDPALDEALERISELAARLRRLRKLA